MSREREDESLESNSQDEHAITDYVTGAALIPLVTSITHVDIPGGGIGHQIDRRTLEVHLSKLAQLNPTNTGEVEIVQRVSRILDTIMAQLERQGKL